MPNTVPPTGKKIILDVLESIDKVKTLKYNLKLAERIKGKILNTQSVVKLQKKPRKIYLYLKGPELLWIEGENDGKAFVNPGGFPYINLNLDPMGSLLRKDQHHTLNEMGYDYYSSILEGVLNKSGDNIDKNIVLTGEEIWNNRACYKVALSFPDFAFINYTVKKGENLIKISRKLNVSEYMILENNPTIDDYFDVKEGDIIKVPNAYAKLTVLLIDKEFMLPINTKIYDDKGLFESYEYYNLQVNPVISDEEFTRHYKGYKF